MEFRRSTAFLSFQTKSGVFLTKAVGPFAGGQYIESAGFYASSSATAYCRVGLGVSGSGDESTQNFQSSEKIIRRRERNVTGASVWDNNHIRVRLASTLSAMWEFPVWKWLERGGMWLLWRFEVEGIGTYDFAAWVMCAEPLGGGVVRGALPVSEVMLDGGTEGGGTGTVPG